VFGIRACLGMWWVEMRRRESGVRESFAILDRGVKLEIAVLGFGD
jgi:hypothetical protein